MLDTRSWMLDARYRSFEYLYTQALHYSSIPLFHYSIIPFLSCSPSPPLLRSASTLELLLRLVRGHQDRIPQRGKRGCIDHIEPGNIIDGDFLLNRDSKSIGPDDCSLPDVNIRSKQSS